MGKSSVRELHLLLLPGNTRLRLRAMHHPRPSPPGAGLRGPHPGGLRKRSPTGHQRHHQSPPGRQHARTSPLGPSGVGMQSGQHLPDSTLFPGHYRDTPPAPHHSELGQVRAQENGCRELSVSLSQFPHLLCQQLGGTGDPAVRIPRHSPCSCSGVGRADQEAAWLGKGQPGRRTAESGAQRPGRSFRNAREFAGQRGKGGVCQARPGRAEGR